MLEYTLGEDFLLGALSLGQDLKREREFWGRDGASTYILQTPWVHGHQFNPGDILWVWDNMVKGIWSHD